ncbi:MAG: carboxymuconolactone decarboxylase family protein [Planctomycetaceae bacterium]
MPQVETMPHVEPLDLTNAPHEAHDLLAAMKEEHGQILNIFGTMAHQPDVLKGIAMVNEGIQKKLPAKLRELAYFAASQANDCEYCSHYHSKAAMKAGLSSEQLRAATHDCESSDLLSDAEKSVVKYAQELTKTGNVSDSTVAAVKEHIADEELVTLAATVALANFTNRFNHGLNVQLP